MNGQLEIAWWGFMILGVMVLFVMLGLLGGAFGGPKRRRPPGVGSDSPSTPNLRDDSTSTPQDTLVGEPQDFPASTPPAGVWSTDEPVTPPAVTVRNRWRVEWLVLILMKAGFTVLLGWTIWEPWYDRVAVFVALAAVLATIGFLQLRIRLEADLNGVVVANLFRRHTLNWAKIEAIDVEPIVIRDAPTREVLRFRVPEGDVTSQAAQVARPEVRGLAQQLQELQVAALQPREGAPAGVTHRVPKLRAWQSWAIGLGVAVSAFAGLVMLVGEAPRRDTPLYFPRDLAIGDCIQVDATDPVVLDCTEPHDAEVYAIYDLPAGTERSEAAAFDAAREYCRGELRSFLGVDNLADTTVRAFAGWDGADRVQCIAVAPEDVNRSLQGSSR